jgi:hypothetical protein
LNAFWKVISPVPVTLKRFFALELVFTFGIIIILSITPYWRSCTGETLVEPCGKWIAKVVQVENIAKKKASKIEALDNIYIENQLFSQFHFLKTKRLASFYPLLLVGKWQTFSFLLV